MRSFVLLILAFFLFAGCEYPNHQTDSINPLIGNLSFESAFNRSPNAQDDPSLRIQTHLQYVHDFLSNKTELSEEQKTRRGKILELLQEYIDAGEFPYNKKFVEERRPCFIDDLGNRCAVAYLIENTSGSDLAFAINDLFQYDLIQDMEGKELDQWISNSGLTREEVAMIQPTYDFMNVIYPNYAGVRYTGNYVLDNAFTSGDYTSINRRYNQTWGLTFDLNTKRKINYRFGLMIANRDFAIEDHLSSNAQMAEVGLKYLAMPFHFAYSPGILRGKIKLELGAVSLLKVAEKLPERLDYIVNEELQTIGNTKFLLQPSTKVKFHFPSRNYRGSLYIETSADYNLEGYSNFHASDFITLGFGVGYHRNW